MTWQIQVRGTDGSWQNSSVEPDWTTVLKVVETLLTATPSPVRLVAYATVQEFVIANLEELKTLRSTLVG